MQSRAPTAGNACAQQALVVVLLAKKKVDSYDPPKQDGGSIKPKI